MSGRGPAPRVRVGIARRRGAAAAAADDAQEATREVAADLDELRLDLSKLSYRDAMATMRERATSAYLIALMTSFQGNVSRAAERAGIARESLHRLLKRYDMDPDAFRSRGR